VAKVYGIESKTGERRFRPEWDLLDAAHYARYFHYSLICREGDEIVEIVDVDEWSRAKIGIS